MKPQLEEVKTFSTFGFINCKDIFFKLFADRKVDNKKEAFWISKAKVKNKDKFPELLQASRQYLIVKCAQGKVQLSI